MPEAIPKSREKLCWIYAWQVMLTLLETVSKSEPKGSQQMMKSMQTCIEKQGKNICQKKRWKQVPKPGGAGSQILPNTHHFSLRPRRSRQRYINNFIYIIAMLIRVAFRCFLPLYIAYTFRLGAHCLGYLGLWYRRRLVMDLLVLQTSRSWDLCMLVAFTGPSAFACWYVGSLTLKTLGFGGPYRFDLVMIRL